MKAELGEALLPTWAGYRARVKMKAPGPFESTPLPFSALASALTVRALTCVHGAHIWLPCKTSSEDRPGKQLVQEFWGPRHPHAWSRADHGLQKA